MGEMLKPKKPQTPMLPFKAKVFKAPAPSVLDCNFKPGDFFILGDMNPPTVRVETIRLVNDLLPANLEEELGGRDVHRYRFRLSGDPIIEGGPRVEHGWGDAHGYQMLFIDDPAGSGMFCITYWVPGTVQFFPLWPDTKTRHLGYDIRHCLKVRRNA